jgi:hypothetical protein
MFSPSRHDSALLGDRGKAWLILSLEWSFLEAFSSSSPLPSPLLTGEEDVPVSLVFLPLSNPGFFLGLY